MGPLDSLKMKLVTREGENFQLHPISYSPTSISERGKETELYKDLNNETQKASKLVGIKIANEECCWGK